MKMNSESPSIFLAQTVSLIDFSSFRVHVKASGIYDGC